MGDSVNEIETTPAPAGMSPGMTGYRWTTAHGDTVEVWQAAGLGESLDWRWHVQSRNGEVVGHGEGHTRRRAAREAAQRHHPPVGEPSAELVDKLTELLDAAGPRDWPLDAALDRSRELAAAWAKELAAAVRPLQAASAPPVTDTTAVVLPRQWLALHEHEPTHGDRVLLGGQRHEVLHLDRYPDRVVVHLARVGRHTEPTPRPKVAPLLVVAQNRGYAVRSLESAGVLGPDGVLTGPDLSFRVVPQVDGLRGYDHVRIHVDPFWEAAHGYRELLGVLEVIRGGVEWVGQDPPFWWTAESKPAAPGGPWTRHGHAVRGVTVDGPGRPPVARCGGPAVCGQCARDAAALQHERASRG